MYEVHLANIEDARQIQPSTKPSEPEIFKLYFLTRGQVDAFEHSYKKIVGDLAANGIRIKLERL